MTPSGIRILVVDDEPDIVELIKFNLQRAGYHILTAADGRDGLSQARNARPDMVLLDWMLPHITGAEICRQLRDAPETRTLPIIMLTAKGEEADKIGALNIGADDYVTKPFSPAELIARVAAVLRRTDNRPRDRTLKTGPLFMDLMRRRVHLSDVEVHLGPTEFRLLEHFMQHPGEVFSRERLLELIWGKDIFVEERTVDVHIRRLRKALGDDGDPGLIRTVRSAGYALNTPDERA